MKVNIILKLIFSKKNRDFIFLSSLFLKIIPGTNSNLGLPNRSFFSYSFSAYQQTSTLYDRTNAKLAKYSAKSKTARLRRIPALP